MPASVSIVIPCFNAAQFLLETLASIGQQTYRAHEIIVVDDGSNDGTADLLKKQNIPELIYVYQTNQGVSAARNKGFSMASGEYVVFLDADDLLEPDFLKARLEVLEKHPQLIFACSTVNTIDGKGHRLEKTLQPICENVEEEIALYKNNFCSCPSNYLIRKNAQTNQLRFHPQLSNAADRFFLLQLTRVGKGFRLNDKATLNYRIHDGSMSKHIQPKNIRDLMLFYRFCLEHGLIAKHHYLQFKIKTFRICFFESLLSKKIGLALRSIFFVLLKR